MPKYATFSLACFHGASNMAVVLEVEWTEWTSQNLVRTWAYHQYSQSSNTV